MGLVLRPCLRCRSDNGQIGKKQEGHKNADISGTVSPIYFALGQCIGEDVPYHTITLFLWQCHYQVHMGAQNTSGMFFWLKNTNN